MTYRLRLNFLFGCVKKRSAVVKQHFEFHWLSVFQAGLWVMFLVCYSNSVTLIYSFLLTQENVWLSTLCLLLPRTNYARHITHGPGNQSLSQFFYNCASNPANKIQLSTKEEDILERSLHFLFYSLENNQLAPSLLANTVMSTELRVLDAFNKITIHCYECSPIIFYKSWS